MKKQSRLYLIFLLLSFQGINAQSSLPCPNSNTPGADICQNVCIYANLSGYSGKEYSGTGCFVKETREIPLCPNQTFILDDINYAAPWVLIDTLYSNTGDCDTIVTYNLTPLPYIYATKTVKFCSNESAVIDGMTFNQEGTYFSNHPVASTSGGCDTIFTYYLEEQPLPVIRDTIVLKPGEQTVINGVTYSAPAVVNNIIEAAIGCDTVHRHVLLLDLSFPDTCAKTESFLKLIGQAGVPERGGVICAAADGNFYIAGERGDQSLILKVTSDGEVLWSRTFQPVPSAKTAITDLIEDSDGMLAGCGIVRPDTFSPEAYAFRYNPVTGAMIWSKYLKQAKPEAFAILEKKTGGNFYLLVSPQLTKNVDDAEIWELNRNTGAAVGALADRYNLGTMDVWNSMVVHDSSLYVVGRHIPGPIEIPAPLYKMRMGLSRLDTFTEKPVWSRLSHLDSAASATIYGTDLLIHDDAIVALSTGRESPAPNSAFFLQKTSLDGDLLWMNRYVVPGLQSAEGHDIQRLSDGYAIIGQASFDFDGWNKIVVKTDFDGDLLWAKRISSSGIYDPGQYFLQNHGSVVVNDKLYVTGLTESFPTDILLLKMTAEGEVSDSCGFVQDFDIEVQNISNPVNKAVQFPDALFVVQSVNAPAAVSSLEVTSKTFCLRCCEPLQIANSITFCPGDTVVIGGNVYTQPGTVVDTFPGSIGCDTIVTNTLQFITSPNSSVSIDCPENIDIPSSPGAGPVPVNYNLPVSMSDCECPGIALTLTQGLPPGALFSPGPTTVCYAAKDSCGNTASCCFEVFIREEQACDVKTVGCMKYELLSITQDASSKKTYRIRVTNNCNNPLTYTAIQLPNGMTAKKPLDNTIYTAPGGRQYLVRNPNFAPFYSIRFKSTTDSISGGESDILEYTLPAQAQPAYIHITSRLEPQVYYEAYLNTFYCPVGMTFVNREDDSGERDITTSKKVLNLRVFPNPTDAALFADLTAWQGEQLQILVFNSQGQSVQALSVQASDTPQEIRLPATLVNGLYVLEILTGSGEKDTARFVIQH